MSEDTSNTELPRYVAEDQATSANKKKGLSWKRRTAIAAVMAVTGVAAQPAIQNFLNPSEKAQATEYHQNEWADKIRAVLKGELSLDGLTIVENLEVIPTEEDPNVRDGFPSTIRTGGAAGPADVPILGKLPAGTVIPRGVEVLGNVNGEETLWVAFLARDAAGKVTGTDGNPVQFDNPDQVITVLRSYLTPQNPAPTPTPTPTQ
jgi:hypothetical protein